MTVKAQVDPHDCLGQSGVIVCGPTRPHHKYPWMSRPVTEEEINMVPADHDLRECHTCHRRFVERCNFDLDFA